MLHVACCSSHRVTAGARGRGRQPAEGAEDVTREAPRGNTPEGAVVLARDADSVYAPGPVVHPSCYDLGPEELARPAWAEWFRDEIARVSHRVVRRPSELASRVKPCRKAAATSLVERRLPLPQDQGKIYFPTRRCRYAA